MKPIYTLLLVLNFGLTGLPYEMKAQPETYDSRQGTSQRKLPLDTGGGISAYHNYHYSVEELEDLVIEYSREYAEIFSANEELRTQLDKEKRLTRSLEFLYQREKKEIQILREALLNAKNLLEQERYKLELSRERAQLREQQMKMQIDFLTGEIEQLNEEYDLAVKRFMAEIHRLRNMLFSSTFRITALTRRWSNTRLELTKENDMRIRGSKITNLFIEFRTGRHDYELPAYKFTMIFRPPSGEPVDLFSNFPLETLEGDVDFTIPFIRSERPSFEMERGDYDIIITYESNQELFEHRRSFTVK